MDFGKLLNVAQRNSATEKKSEVKYYTTKFAPPKKEKKQNKLSANIQKFLAKKEVEEKEKALFEKQKRDELLAKRDPKMKRKIEKMLKVIKSANKSVLDDAVDNQNTAVTLDGPEQPDEDDYGYTSSVSDAFYKKLMDKYKNMPEEKKFKDSVKTTLTKEEILKTKARVRDALNKAQEEENAPHRRQRQSKTRQEGDKYEPEAEKIYEAEKKVEEIKKKPKIRPMGPPPPDFQTLLKLAEQKQLQPIQVETPTDKKEPERLMTKKEKQEMEERMLYLQEKKKRDRIRNNPALLAKAKEYSASKKEGEKQKMEPGGRIPKLNGGPSSSGRIPKLNSMPPPPSRATSSSSSTKPAPTKADDRKPQIPPGKSKLEAALTSKKPAPASSKPQTPAPKPSSSSAMKKPATSIQPSKPSKDQNGGKQRPDVQKSRQFPPQDVQKTRQFPPPDVVQRKRQHAAKLKEMMAKKRKIIDEDDDSEYDSEMDDFIDDEEGEEDYSSHIKSIFGYDKSRYRDEDFDDRQMESNFAQQMREEYISKKIGIMEDLEDMKQEALEKKMKEMKNKKKS